MSLLSQTAALGIYDLRPGSMIRCEIESYQAALDLLPPLLASVSSLPDRMSSEQLGKIGRARLNSSHIATSRMPSSA